MFVQLQSSDRSHVFLDWRGCCTNKICDFVAFNFLQNTWRFYCLLLKVKNNWCTWLSNVFCKDFFWIIWIRLLCIKTSVRPMFIAINTGWQTHLWDKNYVLINFSCHNFERLTTDFLKPCFQFEFCLMLHLFSFFCEILKHFVVTSGHCDKRCGSS